MWNSNDRRAANNDGMDPDWKPLATPEKQEGRMITRAELAQAFGQAYCTKENSHKVLDAEVGIAMADILFPEVHNASQN